MKKNHSNKQSDSLLDAFKGEALTDMGQLRSMQGGTGGTHTRLTVDTNDAHTQGDVGNCDSDTRLDPDYRPDGGGILFPTLPT